jgi:hypothetical protein
MVMLDLRTKSRRTIRRSCLICCGLKALLYQIVKSKVMNYEKTA